MRRHRAITQHFGISDPNFNFLLLFAQVYLLLVFVWREGRLAQTRALG